MMVSSSPHTPELVHFLQQKILSHPDRQITFAEYMQEVLYHPDYGYYTQPDAIGVRGDFVTSPHLVRDFGELLAEQFLEMWLILGQPNPFTIVEMGAGQGLLAIDILRHLHQNFPLLFQCLRYCIVEQSANFRSHQQQQFQAFPEAGDRVYWQTLAEIPEDSIVGCCFSNELVDAFPVHQVMGQAGRLQEIYVTLPHLSSVTLPQSPPPDPIPASLPPAIPDPISNPIPELIGTDLFQETLGELSTPELQTYFDRLGIDLTTGAYPDPYRTEVNLAALDWLQTLARRLHRGYVLTIDYGYSAQRYYHPARYQGTLQCYYRHRHHNNPYCYVGQQDITAHVDFTTLEQGGSQWGLHSLGYTRQALFLMALGLGDRLKVLGEDPSLLTGKALQHVLQRRQALHQLMDPMGLGNFGVLVQAKGLTVAEEEQSLKGLHSPP